MRVSISACCALCACVVRSFRLAFGEMRCDVWAVMQADGRQCFSVATRPRAITACSNVVPAELTSERQNLAPCTHLRGVSAVSSTEVPNAPLPLRGGSTSHAGLLVRCLPTTATLDEAMFTANCTNALTACSAPTVHPATSYGSVDRSRQRPSSCMHSGTACSHACGARRDGASQVQVGAQRGAHRWPGVGLDCDRHRRQVVHLLFSSSCRSFILHLSEVPNCFIWPRVHLNIAWSY
jgi:hypothetical protein